MRNLLVIICVTASLFSSAQNKDNFTLTGVIDKGYAYKIHLRYTTDTETAFGVDVNETSIITDGKFSFHGHINRPMQAYLVLDGLSSRAPFYLDTGKISIIATADRDNGVTESVNKIEITSVKGSASDSLQKAFLARRKQIFDSGKDDSVIVNDLAAEILSLVKQNPDHNLSSEILSATYQLSYTQAKLIYDNLSANQQQNATRTGVSVELERAKHISSLYPFIAQADTSGHLIDGKTSHMKFLLMSFWASECGFCRQRNIEFETLYKAYSKKGLEIISVSIDDTKQEWIEAINRGKLPWLQVSDLKGHQNEIAQYFKIPHLPFIVLMDGKGKILSVNPGKERLRKILERLIN